MITDNLFKILQTPPYTPITIDSCRSSPSPTKKSNGKFKSLSPSVLSSIKRVLDFNLIDSPFKRKNKISKRDVVKEKGCSRINFAKLR